MSEVKTYEHRTRSLTKFTATNASRHLPPENIVPVQYRKSKLKLKSRNIKKTIQFRMISYSESFKIKWNYENWSWEK